MESIWHSLTIAVMSTIVCVTLGTLCAVGCWRLTSRLSEGVRSLMLLPIVIPSIVYSLGIYRMFVDLSLIDSALGVILAHTVTGIPYVVITVSASLANFGGGELSKRMGFPDRGCSKPKSVACSAWPRKDVRAARASSGSLCREALKPAP